MTIDHKCGDAITTLHNFRDYVKNYKEGKERQIELAQVTRLSIEKQEVELIVREDNKQVKF